MRLQVGQDVPGLDEGIHVRACRYFHHGGIILFLTRTSAIAPIPIKTQ